MDKDQDGNDKDNNTLEETPKCYREVVEVIKGVTYRYRINHPISREALQNLANKILEQEVQQRVQEDLAKRESDAES